MSRSITKIKKIRGLVIPAILAIVFSSSYAGYFETNASTQSNETSYWQRFEVCDVGDVHDPECSRLFNGIPIEEYVETSVDGSTENFIL